MKIGSSDISAAYIGSTAINKVYIGSTEVWSAMDADYAAILNYATTQGYTLPSASQQTLQNQLVVDLKAAGIWSKLDTFAVFATDGDSDFALIDWINLSQYTAYNSPTFTADQGFQGDGTSSYIDTNFNLSTATNYSLTYASFGYYMRLVGTITSDNEGAMTADDGTYRIWPRFTSKRLYFNDGSFASYSGDIHGDNLLSSFVRVGSSDIKTYTNGSLLQNLSRTATGVPNANLILLYSVPSSNYTNSQLSMVYAGGDLSAEQGDFYTAFYTNYLSNL